MHIMIYTSVNLCFHSNHFSSEQRQAEVTLFCHWRGLQSHPVLSCWSRHFWSNKNLSTTITYM